MPAGQIHDRRPRAGGAGTAANASRISTAVDEFTSPESSTRNWRARDVNAVAAVLAEP
jgi:hypothetical protein